MTSRRLPRINNGCAIGVPLIGAQNNVELQAMLSAGADFFEIRLDLTSCTNPNDAKQLARSVTPYPFLATYRSKSEGGQGEDTKLGYVLLAATVSAACAIDIELSATELLAELSPVLREQNCELIASAHFLHQTPSLDKLQQCVAQGIEAKAGIVKIATKVNSTNDIDTLLKLLANHSDQNIPLAVMGMGELELASRSRIACARAGSVFTFAQHGLPTAPGQPQLSWLAAQLHADPTNPAVA